jgi:porphobilinogen synthase
VAEASLEARRLIQPLFTCETAAMAGPVGSLPGVGRETLDETLRTVEADLEAGLRSFLLFGLPEHKDLTGDLAVRPDGVTQRTLAALKARFGDALVLSVDVCLCPHLAHGHCGFVTDDGEVENDRSAARLALVARSYADAGADVVAPSDMMDGRIGLMRSALDEAGHTGVSILSYAVKYASSYYGPFREAAHSAPSFGDRRSYQMDPRNGREALVELREDLDEGADLVMVKPALAYLDVIARVRAASDVPVVAYNVSGEYAAVKALAAQGLADATKLALENLHAMRRAGADLVISYHARELARGGHLPA